MGKTWCDQVLFGSYDVTRWGDVGLRWATFGSLGLFRRVTASYGWIGMGEAVMIGNDVFRGDLAKFGMVWQSGFVGKGKFRSVLVRHVKAVGLWQVRLE